MSNTNGKAYCCQDKPKRFERCPKTRIRYRSGYERKIKNDDKEEDRPKTALFFKEREERKNDKKGKGKLFATDKGKLLNSSGK